MAQVSMGSISPAHWSYNVALDGYVRGETVVFSRAGDQLYVGTGAGTIFVMPGPGAGPDDFWTQRAADPEVGIHATIPGLGPWYGGCRYMGACPYGMWCPANCPTGAESEVKKFSIGSPIRKLLHL